MRWTHRSFFATHSHNFEDRELKIGTARISRQDQRFSEIEFGGNVSESFKRSHQFKYLSGYTTMVFFYST